MIEILTEGLQELIDFIKTASPVIWETLVRQAYNDGISYILWAIFSGIGALVLFRLAKKLINEYKAAGDSSSGKDILSGFSYVAAGILSVLVPAFVITGVRMLVNPYYYAITGIIKTLTGK